MRIAQVSPQYERVPPRRYGGTERVVAHLCDELPTGPTAPTEGVRPQRARGVGAGGPVTELVE